LADVICIGAHVLDVIGGPVDEMPAPNRLAMVDEIGIMMGELDIDTTGLRVHPTLQTSMSMHAIGLDGERRPTTSSDPTGRSRSPIWRASRVPAPGSCTSAGST
jgi:hypothetical protein